MKQIKDIKNKIEWEQYYSPDFDWANIAFYANNILSEEFIREFQDKINWKHVSRCQKLSEDFIREFQDKVNWKEISWNQKLSEDFIREFQDKVYWNNISSFQTLSENFIKEFQDKVHWNNIFQHKKLTESFLKNDFPNLPKTQDIFMLQNLNIAFIFQDLSEEIIRIFIDKYKAHKKLSIIDWNKISQYQILSENFIREFKDKVNWERISQYQTLSEDFIREFKDKVDWDSISKCQKLSEEFIEEFKHKIYWNKLFKYNEKVNLSKEFKRKYMWVAQLCNELLQLSDDLLINGEE